MFCDALRTIRQRMCLFRCPMTNAPSTTSQLEMCAQIDKTGVKSTAPRFSAMEAKVSPCLRVYGRTEMALQRAPRDTRCTLDTRLGLTHACTTYRMRLAAAFARAGELR